MSSFPNPLRLVFTDLDGSLLDHHTYSYAAALPVLSLLEREHTPVIFCSSKTRQEIEELRTALGNTHPFIVENGAAVLVPQGYFSRLPPGLSLRDGYHVHETGGKRSHWQDLLARLQADYADEFQSFQEMGGQGVAEATGLPLAQALRASHREYSEPVNWLGTAERKSSFVTELESMGAQVLQGGRFLSVSGECDKGRALDWLRQLYEMQAGDPVQTTHDLAVGDSDNDLAMLLAAETALLVRSPVHEFPALERDDRRVIRTVETGPKGWAEGVQQWLSWFKKI